MESIKLSRQDSFSSCRHSESISGGKIPQTLPAACLRCTDSSELLSDGRLDPHVTQTELPRLAICYTAWDDACDRHSLTPCVCRKPRPMLRGLNRDVYYAMKALWSENQCFDCPGEREWSALGNLHLSGEVPFERYAASTACCCSHGCRVARALAEWRDVEKRRRGLSIHPLLPHPLLPLCCCRCYRCSPMCCTSTRRT